MGKTFKSCIIFAVILMVVITIAITGCANAQNDTDVDDTKVKTVESEKNEETEYFLNGIDVSQHQGTIDFTKVDAKVIVVRLGYSGYGSGKCMVDSKFYENMNKLENYTGEVALYWASHSITTKEVEVENEFIINTLRSLSSEMVEKIDYLFIDREQSGTNEGRADNLSKLQFNEVLGAQINGLQKKLPNMKIGVYTNIDYLVNMIDYDAVGDVPCWIAWYVNEEPTSFEDVINRVAKTSVESAEYLENNIVMWQYSERGQVSGITENVVDLNLVSSKVIK